MCFPCVYRHARHAPCAYHILSDLIEHCNYCLYQYVYLLHCEYCMYQYVYMHYDHCAYNYHYAHCAEKTKGHEQQGQ